MDKSLRDHGGRVHADENMPAGDQVSGTVGLRFRAKRRSPSTPYLGSMGRPTRFPRAFRWIGNRSEILGISKKELLCCCATAFFVRQTLFVTIRCSLL